MSGSDDRKSFDGNFLNTRLDKDSDLNSVRDLFQANGFERTLEEVRWIYKPVKGIGSFATVAMDGDQVAALYAAVPARFKIGPDTVCSAQSLDTMVDESYRGLGLFTKLARNTYSLMSESNVAFVFGFPNGNSYPGFTKKLGWISLDPVPFLFRPLNLGYVAKRLSQKWGSLLKISVPVIGAKDFGENLDGLPAREDVDALWAHFSSHVSVGRVRDFDFLHTRYESHPRALYSYRSYYEAETLIGLSIYCVEEKHGGKIGYLMELMTLHGRDDVAKKLITSVLYEMQRDGCDGALAWCFSHGPYYGQFITSMFMPLPVAMRPIELHFGFLPLGCGDPVLNDRRSWYISYGDSDTV